MKINADKKEMNIQFHYGFQDLLSEVERLEDVAIEASGSADALIDEIGGAVSDLADSVSM